jgi:hypothetical protein
MTTFIRQPLLEQIEDITVRDSIQWILDYVRNQSLLNGSFQHFEVEIKKAVTNEAIPHRLNFTPKDVIFTSQIGLGVVTFNYGRFDERNLYLSTTGPCTVRFFAGRYQDGG